jgi:hypothetical protein
MAVDVTCVTVLPAEYDFSLQLSGTTHYCDNPSSPILLVEQGGMTQAEFNTLWPLLMGLFVTGWIVQRILRMV